MFSPGNGLAGRFAGTLNLSGRHGDPAMTLCRAVTNIVAVCDTALLLEGVDRRRPRSKRRRSFRRADLQSTHRSSSRVYACTRAQSALARLIGWREVLRQVDGLDGAGGAVTASGSAAWRCRRGAGGVLVRPQGLGLVLLPASCWWRCGGLRVRGLVAIPGELLVALVRPRGSRPSRIVGAA